MDFEAARANMVDSQIRTTDVTAHSVLQAFFSVPRENFVSPAMKSTAYVDINISIAPGRYMMAASPLAKLLQLGTITKTDKVLEIGAGTGYETALLSQLSGSVVAVESDDALAQQAAANLAALDCQNVSLFSAPLEAGAAAQGPYDLIFINGAVEEVPAALFDQVKDGGRLVAVVGYGNTGSATVFVKEQGVVSQSTAFNASLKPLPGFAKPKEFVF